jgi:flagellar M-ring protein FliF
MTKDLTRFFESIPGLKPLAMLLGLAAAVAGGIFIYNWSHGPDYALLFSELADRDAMEVADSLRANAIPYRLEAGGRGVSVPRAQLDDARLKLAAKGLPRSAGMGAEMLRDAQGFGTSPSLESARFQMALETELARTVSSLRPVQGARVHLAIPKAAAFSRDRRPASASVFLSLYPGRTLENEQVAAITNLVASSVPDLDASRVTVIDERGHLLSQSDAGTELGASSAQLDYTRRIEDDLEQRVQNLLLPMTGSGRVHAKVNADIDFASTEEAREHYGEPAALRSEQTSEQTQRAGLPQGVPGATSNQPIRAGGSQAPAGVQGSVDAANQSRQSTRNYELDKTISHTRQPSGRIKRLSVAVLVDLLPRTDTKGAVSQQPLTDEERSRLEGLVREAVGFDEKRGDTVAVMNTAFQHDAETAVEPVPIWERSWVVDVARGVGGLLLLLALVMLVVRPALHGLFNSSSSAVAALPGGGAQLLEDRATLTATPIALGAPSSGRAKAYEDKLTQAKSAVAQDPKRVAQVVKTWVAADG